MRCGARSLPDVGCGMDAEFGARMRAHREARRLTLQGIAAETKIKQSLLHGLECDDLSAWPKGIFRRAFVKDYARAIGLDPETVVREFLECHPDPVEQTPFGPGGAPLTETDLVQVHAQSPTRLQRLIDAAKTAVPRLNRADRANRLDARSQEGGADNVQRSSPRHLQDTEVATATAVEVDPPIFASPGSFPAEPSADTSEEAHHALDLSALADLCMRFALVAEWEQFKAALADTTRILDAVGVMLWCWEPGTSLLRPVAAHGYPEAVIARLTRIDFQDDTAIARAFRSSATCVVPAEGASTAAVAVPVVAPAGCVGVLAFEVGDGREQDSTLTAAATIIAAQLAALLTPAAEPHAVSA